MKKIVFAFGLIVAVAMTACTPETLNERLGIPEDAILLSSERFSGHGTKTSVSDISVKWVNEDKVYLNGSEYSVTVDNSGNAYVNASDEIRNSEVYGYYGVLGTPSWNSSEKKLTVTVPSEYTSSYDGGRQVIALPMVAYKSGAANKIEFKHVTAAVKVRVKNTTNYVLELDKVVVSSSTLQLSGTRDVTLNTCVVSDQSGEISTDDKSVTVNFETNTFVNPYGDDDNNIKEVQVPILPVGSGSLTIQIYAHVAGTPAKANTYVYDHTESGAAIGRNIMITAGVNLGGSYTTASLKGLFTVSSSGKQVFFSKGNLQYIGSAATPYWKFADNQYSYLETTTGQNSAAVNVDRDLFGWATSGYHNNGDPYNINYNPYSTSEIAATYNSDPASAYQTNRYGYGPSTTMTDQNLTNTSANYDWGWNNPIYNGGNVENQWNALSKDEFSYILNTRATSYRIGYSTTRYIYAYLLNSYHGIILLPDNYVHPGDVTTPVFGADGWSSNVFSAADWSKMEANGAVFLPAAGQRKGETVSQIETQGNYWTTTNSNVTNAHYYYFTSSNVKTSTTIRYFGYSVRLVQKAN